MGNVRRDRRYGVFGVRVAAAVLLSGTGAGAAVTGRYQMEVDNDPSATAVSVPDSSGTAGASPLTSTTAVLAAPGAGASPANGLDGQVEVNATIASYPALNSASISVDGFFRTNEGTATLVARTTGTKGYRIDSANDVTATFFVNNVSFSVKGGTGGLPGGAIDLSAGTEAAPAYTQILFAYDATTGLANLFANNVLRGTVTVPGGGPMFVAGDAINVSVGAAYDGGDTAGNPGGLIDEVRFQDVAVVPEPGSLALLAIPAAGLLARRRRRRRSANGA